MWDVIVLIHDHCLSIYFWCSLGGIRIDLTLKKSNILSIGDEWIHLQGKQLYYLYHNFLFNVDKLLPRLSF